MEINREGIAALVGLQAEDSALDALKAERDLIPEKIADLRALLDKERQRVQAAKAKTVELEKKKKECELELAAKEESARKHSVELNMVKTNEAFKALQHEIEAEKRSGSDIETRILEIMEEIDASRTEEKRAALLVTDEEKKISVDISAMESKLSEVSGACEKAESGRNASAQSVPEGLLKVYERIRGRRIYDAIVAVEGGHCGACRIALTPQQMVESAKAKSIVFCENCQRILYKPLEPVPAAGEAKIEK